jgi:RNA polymerase sigma factor (sigma-70 family)
VADKETGKEFERQVRAHEALIHKVCRMYAYTEADRQDLFQEIVIHLWKSYPTFRGQAKFSTWLYRVAINTAVTGLRRQKDVSTPYELLAHHEVADEKGPEEEQWQQLYRAITGP